eukprot:scaffold13926_cov58-Phaeocystis_antarctica.AAC.3
MTSARPLDAPPSQLPAAASGTPGGCHRCGCVGHLSMWRQRCLMPTAGIPVSVMSTVTPKAKPSVSSVATPSFMLRHTRGERRALWWVVGQTGGGQAKGGGGGALDRVEEGGGSADCTDGGDGGVGAGALLGHARQTKVRQPRLAARVEEDVARLDLHAAQQAICAPLWWWWWCLSQAGLPYVGQPICHLCSRPLIYSGRLRRHATGRAAAHAGEPARAPRRVGWSAAAATSVAQAAPPSRARRGERSRRWCSPAGPRACRPRTAGTPGRAAGTTRGSSLAAVAGSRAACTAQAAPPLSAPPWPRRRSHAHPARHRARRRDHRRDLPRAFRRRRRPRSAASRRTGHGVAARAERPPCGTRWRSRPCPRLAQSRRWRSAAPGMSAPAGPLVVAGARVVAAARQVVAVWLGEVVRQQAAAWRRGWPRGAASRPHGTLHSARSPLLVLAPPPPPAPPPRARLRWPQPGPAPPPRPQPYPPPPSEPRRPPSPPPVARWQLARAALALGARTLRCCRRQ